MTSQLVKWYEKNKSDKFVLVMVSGDRTEKAMLKYMKTKKLNFPAVAFKERGNKKFQKHFAGYFPSISLIGEDDKTVNIDVDLDKIELALKELEKKLK